MTLRPCGRKRAMTESPRRPLMNDLSKTGYRSYTSPSDRLSKRLGASMPNLEQPASDAMPVCFSSSRATSLRKMTPDAGLCRSEGMLPVKEQQTIADFSVALLSHSRAEVSPESLEGVPPSGLPPTVGLLLRPELLL